MVFKTAVFTNLTQDHLDYHQTMANYFAAKQQLFYWETLENAIINADDEYGKLLINDLKRNNSKVNLISYGITNGDLQAQNIEISLQGMKFDLCYNQEKLVVSAPILGRFNVYNLLAVFATLLAHGVKWSEFAIIAANLRSVIGRMDAQIILKKPLVVVDYAHTPDALEKALQTLAEIPHNKLICVFGCGGDRDREKRSIMGGISTRIADYSIITTDNPRTETPMDIIDDIVAGVKVNDNYTIVEDRLQAIELAIINSAANDIILVAGKGHENYQEINGVKHYFSDLESVSKILDGYSK
jgi:UDP-N-acetylmuramoyl-L-alanyl-D-glutamate--2,6-diaminopimelate ligase